MMVDRSSGFITGKHSSFAALLCAGLAAHAFAQTPDDFNPSPDGVVHALALETNSSILLGGEFTTVAGMPRAGLARVDNTGVLDTNFAPAVVGDFAYVAALAVQQDGKILVGGNFASLAGQLRSCLGRLNTDGSFDGTFDTSADSDVYGVLPQPDGKVLVWGYFLSLGGQPRSYIGRVNEDGSPDNNFKPVPNDQVFTVAVQPDGKMVVGGQFSLVNGTNRNGLARLNVEGSLDAGFDPDPGNFAVVSCAAVQPDGKILVAGRFSQLKGTPRTNIGRLNADGSLDGDFAPAVSGGTPVLSMALQADGKIVIGGQLTDVNGKARNYLARLNADGTPDAAFTAETDLEVSSLALDQDGNLMVGGGFGALGGQPRSRLGRLSMAGANIDRFSYDGTTVKWVRSGTLPEFWATAFEWSTNGTDWAGLGPGTPSAAGWQVAATSLPPNAFIRAHGDVAAGRRAGSSYWLTKTQQLSLDTPPEIVVNDQNFGWKSGQFGFNVRGLPGQTIVIEASTNLTPPWSPLATNKFSSTLLYFSDPNSPLEKRYYRARLQ